MSPGTVRWGGIMVFIGIALVFILPIVMVAIVGLEGFQPGAGGIASATGGAKIMSVVMNIAMAAVLIFVFIATKGYFNALSYHRADIPIYIIIGVQVVSAVIGSIMNSSDVFTGLMQSGGMGALGVVGIIVVVTMLALFVALVIFAVFCISFGNLGGGVWKAIGILYLIGLIGIFVGIIVIAASAGFAASSGAGAGTAGGVIAAMVLIAIAGLCYAAAIICHGIGLILGAGRMEREINPVDVF